MHLVLGLLGVVVAGFVVVVASRTTCPHCRSVIRRGHRRCPRCSAGFD
jgi:non-ribosomal peptide synthetase component E (peptide arylation enzyme)